MRTAKVFSRNQQKPSSSFEESSSTGLCTHNFLRRGHLANATDTVQKPRRPHPAMRQAEAAHVVDVAWHNLAGGMGPSSRVIIQTGLRCFTLADETPLSELSGPWGDSERFGCCHSQCKQPAPLICVWKRHSVRWALYSNKVTQYPFCGCSKMCLYECNYTGQKSPDMKPMNTMVSRQTSECLHKTKLTSLLRLISVIH